VVNRTVVPSRTSSRTTAQIWLRLRGSSPAVGSSRKRIRGSLRRLEARSSRRRIPPEYVRAGRSAASTRSKRSSNSPARRRASARDRPNRRPNISRFSRPVRISSTAANCPVRPSSSRTAEGSRTTSRPRTSARPASGTSSVARTRTRVVLPAPFGPSRPNTAPSGTARSTPASATVAPKRLVTPLDPSRGRGGWDLDHARGHDLNILLRGAGQVRMSLRIQPLHGGRNDANVSPELEDQVVDVRRRHRPQGG